MDALRVRFCIGILILLTLCATRGEADETRYALAESDIDLPLVRVKYTLGVEGTLEERVPGAEQTKHKFTSTAELNFGDQSLTSAGPRAQALRSLRYFDSLSTKVTVGEHRTELTLPPSKRLFVVRGTDEELQSYGLERLLTAQELDLLRIPFDPVAARGMLPVREVAVGDSWNCDTWTLQLITGVEAVLNGELKCTLISVADDIAKVSFSTKMSGGRFGASTEIEFAGNFDFDLNRKLMTRFDVEQKEKSSISPVSPGVDVTASIRFTRTAIESHPELTAARVQSVPLEPDPARLVLAYDSPWGTRFLYSRGWHIIQGKLVVLRLMQNGSLISQGTMMGLPKTDPGGHISEEIFQGDIRKSLGSRLKGIVSAEEIETDHDIYLYRVTALGVVEERELVWKYYLCAAPDGRQVSFVFSTDAKLAEQLGERDLGILRSIEWPTVTGPQAAP